MTLIPPQSPSPDRPTYTYFISKGWPGPIKIGRSINPPARLRSLQTGCPDRLFLIATALGDIEKDLHRRFGYSRIRGEWFNPSDALMDWIEDLDDFKEPEDG